MVSLLYWLETWILQVWKTHLVPAAVDLASRRQLVILNLRKKFCFYPVGPFNRQRQFGPPPWVAKFIDWLRDAFLDALVVGFSALILTAMIWFMLYGG